MLEAQVEILIKFVIFETVRRICLQPMNRWSPFLRSFVDNWDFLKNNYNRTSIYHYMTKAEVQAYKECCKKKLLASFPEDLNLRNTSEKLAKIIAKAITNKIDNNIKSVSKCEASININSIVTQAKATELWEILDYKTFLEQTSILFLIVNYKLVQAAFKNFRKYLHQADISEMTYIALIGSDESV